MAYDKSLNEIWTEITERHWKYSETEESMEKIIERKRLETYLKKYLFIVPHDRKFLLPETIHVLKKSIANLTDFSSFKVSNGFESINQYANNLFIKPWRKEYRVIMMYSGFYQHDIKSSLVDAESLFLAMGYKLTSNQTLTLEGAICPDQVMNVSRDAMIAYVECQIMKEIFTDLSAMQIQCSWQDIFTVRENCIGDTKHAIKILTQERMNKKLKMTSPDNCYNPNVSLPLVTCNSCSMRQPLKLPQTSNLQYCNNSCSTAQQPNIYDQQHNINHYSPYMSNAVGQPPVPPLPMQHQPPIISHSKSMDHYDQNMLLQQQQQHQHHQQRHSLDYNYLQQHQQSLPQQMQPQNHSYDAVDGMIPSQYHHHNHQQQVPNCNNNYNHPYNVSGNRYPLPYNLSNSMMENNYLYNNNNNNNSMYKMQQSTGVQVPPESINYYSNHNNNNINSNSIRSMGDVYHTIATQTTPISPMNGFIPNSFPQNINIDGLMTMSNIDCDSKNAMYSASLIDFESTNPTQHNNIHPVARRNKRNSHNVIDIDNTKPLNHQRNHSDYNDSYDDYQQQQKFQQTLASNTNNVINSKSHDGIGSYESWNYVFQNLEQQGYYKDLGEREDLIQDLDLERMNLNTTTGTGMTTSTATPTSAGTLVIPAPQEYSEPLTKVMNSTLSKPKAQTSSTPAFATNRIKSSYNDCYENVPKTNSIGNTLKPQVQKANGSLPNSKQIVNNNVKYIKSSENHLNHSTKKTNVNDNNSAKTTEAPKAKPMLSNSSNNTSNNIKKNVRIDLPTSATGTSATATNKLREWNCKFCTFLNSERDRICEMCAKSRDFALDSSNNTATCV